MFTGLIEEIGQVHNIEPGAESIKINIQADKVLEDIAMGDSIAVNGVCLTVIGFDNQYFSAEAMPETMAKSTLNTLRKGERVNLERALRWDGRLGGHIVQGHVDAVGTIIKREKSDIAVIYTITASSEVMRYVVNKGSIAVEGVSLTIASVQENEFKVSLIPHTADTTILGSKKSGDIVNLETDIIGRYVERLMLPASGFKEKAALSLSFLAENGFM
ncbi:MAG: riboflavin synthase [Syntrophomonadaceae bacterium]|nr:riboflavin synthase [Syntrophomonadaceae bacterium]